MLKAHMKTAMETGVAKNNILITQNGNKVEVTKIMQRSMEKLLPEKPWLTDWELAILEVP